MALDSANNRALVFDRGLDALIAVDLTMGARTILSDTTTPNSVNAFSFPTDVVLDSANNRALLVDIGLGALVAVDLITGARSVLLDTSTVNAFRISARFALDSANNRLLSFSNRGGLAAVNLTTGVHTIVSSASIPDTVNAFFSPQGIALDSANNRALVVDDGLDALMAVDLNTGVRSIVSNDTIPNVVNAFRAPRDVALDSANNRALVIDGDFSDPLAPVPAGSLIAVDLTTGARTILSDDGIPDAVNIFEDPRSVVLDSANNRALVVNNAFNHGANVDSLIAVDLVTGVRTVLSDDNTPDAVNTFSSPQGIALDSANNRVLVVDDGLDALMAVDLSTGARTILSDDTTPDAVNAFSRPRPIALDSINNRVLITDAAFNIEVLANGASTSSGSDVLIAVDLTTGARTIVSEPVPWMR